ncbi:MAG: gamma-glutamyltransferase, partial [Xanthobacteraceae bacterium]
PENVFVEPGIAPEVLDDLAKRGHQITPTRPGTSANSIAVTPDGLIGAADARTRGALAAGH